MLEDIAMLTGIDVISEKLGNELENVKLTNLWFCKRVKVGKENRTIIKGSGKKADIEARSTQIRQQAE